MRIECEVCSATYTIDDAQLSDQPIGAQCPYCGHVRLVRRGDSPSGPPPAAAPGPGLGFGQQPPPRPPFGGAPSRPPPPPPGGGYGAAPAAFNDDPFDRGSPFGGGGAGPGAGFAADLNVPSRGGFDGGATIPSQAPAFDAEAKCQVCGTPLTDEFDKVIGLCDVHQRDRRSGDLGGGPSGVGAAAAAGGAATWHAKTRDGRGYGPLSLDELRNKIRGGELSREDQFSKDGVNFGPIGAHKELAYLASLIGSDAGVGGPKASFAKPRSGPNLGGLVVPVLSLVVVAGIAFLAYAQRDQIGRAIDGFKQGGQPSGPTGPNPLKRYLANWRLAHPDVSGTANEHLVTARARHLEDSWRGYQQAEKAYERAMLLSEDDPNAIAGYVENLVLWRYDLASRDELKIAQAAAEYAADAAPNSPAPQRALAALALAKGNLDGCRSAAERAVQLDATDGRARLLLAGCYLEGNVQLAISEAERARQLIPELRRSDRVLARAYGMSGRFASAFKLLDERLKAEPESSAVHLMYGELARTVGDYEKAEQHLKRAVQSDGDAQAAMIALGEMELERGAPAEAASYFQRAVDARALYEERAARTYSGWARAELSRKRVARAAKLADQAVSLAPKDPGALLVRGEAALFAGSATTAQVYARRALDARDGEPAVLVLAASADAKQGRRDQAVKRFESAIANDPKDPRLKGILGGYYLSFGGAAQAFTLIRRAVDVDPLDARGRTFSGALPISEAAVLEAIEQFRTSSADEQNAAVASAAMGVLYYQLGDMAKAAAAIDKSLRIDTTNVVALTYDAQINLDRGQASEAAKSAQKLLSVERGSAVGHLLYARALRDQKKLDEAMEQYGNALRSNPGLVSAKVERAVLELKEGDRKKIEVELAEAYRVNQASLVIRRTLLAAGL